jgi:hypothetical protein
LPFVAFSTISLTDLHAALVEVKHVF